MGQVSIYSGVERRRRWSDAERFQILKEAFSPGANVMEVARRHDVSTALIYTWRRKHRLAQLEPALGSPDQGFVEAVLVQGDQAAANMAPAIVLDLGRGKRVSIFASAPPALATAALRALR